MATGFLDLDKLPERLFSDFPPKFEQLRAVYKGQVFHPEHHRLSISDFFAHALKNHDLGALQAELNENALPLPIPPYRHRLFYWSTICFYRAFYLLASYLRLDGGALHSWAYVTGYYSKFYLAKALLTLFQTAWVAFNKDRHGRHDLLLAYYGTQGIRVLDSKEQGKTPRGSHQQWWWLYEPSLSRCSFDLPVSKDAGRRDVPSYRSP